MKRIVVCVALLLLASYTFAQRIDETNGKHTQLYPTKDEPRGWAKPGGGGGQNLAYWGGPVIQNAKSVAIFWGPSWGTGNTLNATASELLGFFAQFGTTGEYKVITQYSGIQPASLTNTFWWDSSAPPTNVTDSALEAEVVKYFNQGGVADESTLYSVFLPPGSYSSYGS